MYTLYYIKKNGRKKNYICQCGSIETLKNDIPKYKEMLGKDHKYKIEKA